MQAVTPPTILTQASSSNSLPMASAIAAAAVTAKITELEAIGKVTVSITLSLLNLISLESYSNGLNVYCLLQPIVPVAPGLVEVKSIPPPAVVIPTLSFSTPTTNTTGLSQIHFSTFIWHIEGTI